jgi:hypothetical protein
LVLSNESIFFAVLFTFQESPPEADEPMTPPSLPASPSLPAYALHWQAARPSSAATKGYAGRVWPAGEIVTESGIKRTNRS